MKLHHSILLPQAHRLPNKTAMPGTRSLPQLLVKREFRRLPKTILAMDVALDCLPVLEGKTPLL